MSTDDKPGSIFDGVGDAIVARAARRKHQRHRELADQSARIEEFERGRRCAICRAEPLPDRHWRRSTVGGRNIAICDLCARLAVTDTGYFPDLRSCLVLLALSIDQVAEARVVEPVTGREIDVRRVRAAIAMGVENNFFSDRCMCSSHVHARETFARLSLEAAEKSKKFEREIARKRSGVRAPRSETPAPSEISGLGLSAVRGQPHIVLQDGVRRTKVEVGGELLSANRAATAYPSMKPRGLADTARFFATEQSAEDWTDLHARERATGRADPYWSQSRLHRAELSADDVETLLTVLARPADDFRVFCDWCGLFPEEDATKTFFWDRCSCSCADCRRTIALRLSPVIEGLRGFRQIRFLDDQGDEV